MDPSGIREDRIRDSLRERRDVMAEVLMALQRMGRTPPPAILSRPSDALAAIRGSILAGAVLPDIRMQAEALAKDLGELTQLTARIQSERDGLRARYAALGEEQARIDLLVATKREQRDRTPAARGERPRRHDCRIGGAQSGGRAWLEASHIADIRPSSGLAHPPHENTLLRR